MEHQEAVRQMAVERYLLNELTPAVRDEFEQHFFDCGECAADLSATSAFLDEAKKQLMRPAARPAKAAHKSWMALLFRPAFVSPVFASLLLIIAYQGFVAHPRLTHPEILSSVSLVSGNSRGGPPSSVTVADGKPILMSLDVPAGDEYSGYELALLSPSGATLWRLPISADEAKDTVSIRVPTAHWAPGEYRLIVYGRVSGTAQQPKDVAHYRFDFSDGSH